MTARTITGYLARFQAGFQRLAGQLTSIGWLVVLLGDGRKSGIFFPIHNDVIRWGVLPLEAVLIEMGDHTRRARHLRYGLTRFIPTLREYVLIFKRGAS